MDNNYCVYRHTAPNGKVYIGITSQKPEQRWASGKGYVHNKYFTNAIKKYGWDNIQHDILLDGLTSDQASEFERLYIYMYRSNTPNYGYNKTTGGEKGFSLQGEYKAKFDELMKNPDRREKVSKGLKKYYENPEARMRASQIQKQKWENKDFRERFQKIAQTRAADPEYRKKLSRVLTEKRNTDEYRQSMMGGNNPNAKSVLQYSVDGKLIKKYNSISDACRAVGANHSNIVACINGRLKIAYGFLWDYEDGKNNIDDRVAKLQSYINPKAKSIIQCDLKGNAIKQFRSITEACDSLGASTGTLSMALRGKRKTAYGYIWKYAREEADSCG